MADYYTPTVIVPNIPEAELSKFELFILTQLFDSEDHSGALYFHHPQISFRECSYPVGQLRTILHAYNPDVNSQSQDIWNLIVDNELPEDMLIPIELDEDYLVKLLEGVVERSKVLKRVDIVQSYMCNKMRPDGFGGKRIIITKDNTDIIDTSDLSDEEDGEETSTTVDDNILLETIKELCILTRDMHRCMNGFAEAVRNVTETPYPWPEMDLINERYAKTELDKLEL
jgi:hypothetical protein